MRIGACLPGPRGGGVGITSGFVVNHNGCKSKTMEKNKNVHGSGFDPPSLYVGRFPVSRRGLCFPLRVASVFYIVPCFRVRLEIPSNENHVQHVYLICLSVHGCLDIKVHSDLLWFDPYSPSIAAADR